MTTTQRQCKMQYSGSLGVASSQHMAGSLREAISALYTQDHILQHPADAWLQTFRASPGSWRLCLKLLETPHLQEHECYFAANNIKAACQRHQDVLEPGLLHELLARIAVHMQNSIHNNRWATSQQLASAAAAVAVRATVIQSSSILQDLQSIFIPSATAAAAAAHSSQQHLQLAAAASIYGVQQAVVSSQALGLQLQQDPAPLAAMLLVLSALPDAVLSKQTSVHPDRRTAVTDSLKQSTSVAPALTAAICSRNSKLGTLACQAVISWCDLGCPPRGLEAHADVFDALSTALLVRETAVPACDAVAAMLTAVKESCSSSSSSSNPSMQLLQQIAQQLQANVLPALAAEHHSSVGASAAAGSSAAADTAPYSAVLRAHLGPDAEVAFCRVFSAAAAVILQPVLQGAVQYQPLLEVLLQQLLLSVCVSDDGVAMMAVAFWQNCYIATLQALPLEQQTSLLVQQQAVLEALAGALMQRTQLNPAAAAAATADARDLPEEMRMVRREIASALRDISSLLGQQPMLSYVTRLVTTHYQRLCSTHTAANNSTHSSLVGPTAMGLHGIAASVMGSPWSASPAPGTQHTSQHHSASSTTAVPGHIVPAASRGPTVTSSHPGDWVPLESAMYAAIVVLGRQGSEAAVVQVQRLVQCAAPAVVHEGGSMKLAGTALTLLGGLAAWLATHSAALPVVHTAAVAALQSADEKLSRNAATCVHRLCSCDDLAVVITQSHGQFVQQLLQEYQRRGGLSSKLAEGSDDKPTEELLLLSLCSLAVAHSSNISDMDSILLQLVGPQLTAAADELVASLQGNWSQQQQPALPVHGGCKHQMQTQHRPPHHQQQQQVLQSTAISCFKGLTRLVTGLPTGIDKQALGLPLHRRHPMHQQQMLQQQQQQAATHGSHHLAKVVGPPHCGAAADDASMGSQSASEVNSSTRVQPATAAAVTPCQGQCSHTQCQGPKQQQQQQQRIQAPAAQQRQQQAWFIVSQLLVAASQPVLLAMQVAVKAAGEDQVLCQLIAKQLLSAVCSFLLVAFPAAVQHQLMNERAAAPAAARQEDAGICHSSQQNSQGDLSSGSSSGSALQAGVLLQQLCHLLHQLPVDLLQQTCCLQLKCSAVAAAAAAGALPSQECTAGGSTQYPTSQPSVPAAAGTSSSQQQQQQQQLLQVLQDLTKQALGAAATAILKQQGSADPDHASAALALATVSLQQCPAVLANSDIDLLLSLTLASTRTHYLKQCSAVLNWIQVLMQTAYSQQKQLSSRPECCHSGDQVCRTISSSSDPGCVVIKCLRECLASSIGPQLVLALLLAASGAMPPDVVLPISFCLHSVWLSVGQTTFVSWLTAAVVHIAPESAPWSKQRHVAKVGFVSDMTDAACLKDTTRFKRILKNFCGGKKKGQ